MLTTPMQSKYPLAQKNYPQKHYCRLTILTNAILDKLNCRKLNFKNCFHNYSHIAYTLNI